MRKCNACSADVPEPTPHEAFSAKAWACPNCKAISAIGIEDREHMLLGLFGRVEELEAKVDVMLSVLLDDVSAPTPHRPMPAGPDRKAREGR